MSAPHVVPAPRPSAHVRRKASPAKANRIGVVLGIPCVLFREGLKALLLQEPSIRLLGEVATGKAILTKVRSVHPDVVIMDVKFSDSTGAEVVRRIRQSDRGALILIVTLGDAVEAIAECIEGGASAYVPSDVPAALLVGLINRERGRLAQMARPATGV